MEYNDITFFFLTEGHYYFFIVNKISELFDSSGCVMDVTDWYQQMYANHILRIAERTTLLAEKS